MAILRERARATALFARIPAIEPVDRGFRECCYEHLVLADGASTKTERNDYSHVYFQKQVSTDTCDFVLVKLSDMSEYPLNDATYGEFFDFGDYTDSINMTSYMVEWKKVLLAHGEGQYRIRKDMSVVGVTLSQLSYAFTLRTFSNSLADKTFRFDIMLNVVLERENLNFKNTNFKHSLRTRGFFGNVNPEYEQDLTVYRTKNSNTTTFFQKKDIYVMQTELLPSCITKEIVNFMMFAGDKWMTDYNANNHDYDLIRVPVVMDGNQGHEYWPTSRDARLNYTFSERFLNNIGRNC